MMMLVVEEAVTGGDDGVEGVEDESVAGILAIPKLLQLPAAQECRPFGPRVQSIVAMLMTDVGPTLDWRGHS